jgi:hypothetical protein
MLVRLGKDMTSNSVLKADCRCEIPTCKAPDLTGKVRYEGATRLGIWQIMCAPCWEVHGMGLGIGRGQKFDAQGRCLEGNRVVGGHIPTRED